jgi:hypothetical protein
MEAYVGKFSIDNLDLSLLLDIVNGHHLILKLGNGMLLKVTSNKEAEFYEFYKDYNFGFLPKFYLSIDRSKNPDLNNLIIEYKNKLDLQIYELFMTPDEDKQRSIFISDFKNKYPEMFDLFIKSCEERLLVTKDLEEVKSIQKKIFEFPNKKLNLFLNNFINRFPKSFLRPKFLIMEDLTWGIKKPCIVDFKMGYIYADSFKIEKKKKIKESTQELGLKLLGAQVFIYNLVFQK